VLFTEDELVNLLYTDPMVDLSNFTILDGTYLDKEHFDDDLKFSCKFDASVEKTYADFGKSKKIFKPTHFTHSVNEYHSSFQEKWFMPENYFPNIVEHLYGLCNTQEEEERVSLELELFIQHGMFELLVYLKYLVDTMRENNIVWGVGRGSSVASYVLYLLGVHKVDSIKYELNIHEFLK
jgi:DNA polymerase III alpha subunit